MSEAIITAAWIPDEPKVTVNKEAEAADFLWAIRAEASVTDTDGKPASNLTKSAWKVHVTMPTDLPRRPLFSVAPISAGLTRPFSQGSTWLQVAESATAPGVAPTAFGIAIATRKLALEGQVVVPVALAGPTVVSSLTTPISP